MFIGSEEAIHDGLVLLLQDVVGLGVALSAILSLFDLNIGQFGRTWAIWP